MYIVYCIIYYMLSVIYYILSNYIQINVFLNYFCFLLTFSSHQKKYHNHKFELKVLSLQSEGGNFLNCRY